MDRTMILDAYDPQCPIRNILARMSDKWSLLVIYTLTQTDKMRFRDLRHAIPDISQKMLTVTLRTLEEDGFVKRTIYPEVPPRVEYALTERAVSLFPHINSIDNMGKREHGQYHQRQEERQDKTVFKHI